MAPLQRKCSHFGCQLWTVGGDNVHFLFTIFNLFSNKEELCKNSEFNTEKKSKRTNTNTGFQVFESVVLIQSDISSKNELHILGGTGRG